MRLAIQYTILLFLPFVQSAVTATERPGLQASIAALGYSSWKSAQQYASRILYRNEETGHGVAAEHANQFVHNIVSGHTVTVVGGNNEKDGADYVKTSSQFAKGTQYVQVKYYQSGPRSISSCFKKIKEGGLFRYYSPDGTPMKIEVAPEQVSDAIETMRKMILAGRVPGVVDPDYAAQMITPGYFSYQQARNIAQFAKLDGIVFDAATGAVTSTASGGLAALFSVVGDLAARSDLTTLSVNAVGAGGAAFSASLVTHIVAAQVARTKIELLLRPISDSLVKRLGKHATSTLAKMVSGKALHGASAKNHLSKLLRGYVVGNVISTAVLSVIDVKKYAMNEAGGGETVKNIGRTGAGVFAGGAGWTGGWAAGAAIGSVFPGFGNLIGAGIGAAVGSLGASALAGHASDLALTRVFNLQDDDMVMMGSVQEVMITIVDDYLMIEREVIELVERVETDLDVIIESMREARKVTKMGVKAFHQAANDHIERLAREVVKGRIM